MKYQFYNFLKAKHLNILFYTLLGFLFTDCNITKHLKKDEVLLSKNTIKIEGKTTSDHTITDYLIQRPNSKTLNLPIGLFFYNIGNIDYDSIHKQKILKFQKRNN
ncbi:MAG: hypothetical protein ABF239_03100, partial [Wenyingzhuangia sp.]